MQHSQPKAAQRGFRPLTVEQSFSESRAYMNTHVRLKTSPSSELAEM